MYLQAINHAYPTGKPEVYVQEKLEKNILFDPKHGFILNNKEKTKMVGMVLLSILPPPSLNLPALALSEGGKLIFGEQSPKTIKKCKF